jgi:NAD(P)-dependent dehydrogenase (short-subunit alcohol dehydrogenase family)
VKDFNNKIAVVTGVASGIGRAMAERCVQEGMKVVLADIEETALSQTASEFKSAGANIRSVVTDVSKLEDIRALAHRTLEYFGAVHLLCNNAGIGAGSTAWETSKNDWVWIMNVNFWGVLHGIQVFLPIMLAQEQESYIINTSSIAGLLPYHGEAPYHVSKHAVVALSEKLFYDLGENEGKVKVSVLCPGWVRTRILESERNRPSELLDNTDSMPITPEIEATLREYQQAVETGMPPEEVATQVFLAIQYDRFYILTHPAFTPIVGARLDAITQGNNPPSMAELEAMLAE